VEDYRFCIGCFDISGTVYLDENGDSDISGDGVTPNEVVVRLYRDDDGDGVPSAGDTYLQQMTTSSGAYTIVLFVTAMVMVQQEIRL